MNNAPLPCDSIAERKGDEKEHHQHDRVEEFCETIARFKGTQGRLTDVQRNKLIDVEH